MQSTTLFKILFSLCIAAALPQAALADSDCSDEMAAYDAASEALTICQNIQSDCVADCGWWNPACIHLCAIAVGYCDAEFDALEAATAALRACQMRSEYYSIIQNTIESGEDFSGYDPQY